MTSRAWAEYDAEWHAALAALRADGWTVDLTCSAAPVQVEGMVPSGERFYFRARGTHIMLAVGGDDPADGAPWEREVTYGTTRFAASYLPAGVALGIIRDLYTQFPR